MLTCIAVVAFSTPSSAAAKGKQKTFATQEDAVSSLVAALKANDIKELGAILGPGSETIVSSGDEVRDKAGRERFIKEFEEKNSLERQSEERVVLDVGSDDYPFPIPIVKKGTTWYFDTKAGKDELLSRRIGGNELKVINSLHAFVEAQSEYAFKDLDGNGKLSFAQKFMSSKGKHDGLYWDTKEGEEDSPLGPFVANASLIGYGTKGRSEKPEPFFGYYFRILKAQGPHAIGGTYDYVVKGNMILGFAFVAYPAKYGSSGIMTFIVNQEGVVYQKDLGKDTEKLAKAIKRYDPDKTWAKVEETKE
ncbi:MAG TPA: DUF2950 domain-containing protein [Thermodesulfovibrionales bacterium]|nr:DUF2950 domain-containing protein [Thermodesulfovibrionales bacterium]